MEAGNDPRPMPARTVNNGRRFADAMPVGISLKSDRSDFRKISQAFMRAGVLPIIQSRPAVVRLHCSI
ncbi:hypothetical protein [Bradyrhizobium sp. NP1]|uniref:hypothetical protein n=1 Tax=Bradyrhizobium sp. NP1 TaxID=3049772 RepID=UPI0025A63979|nr:hypothetical protein [Bradyrhizobium sp. NP1]WJR76269.1 hypothetical protein QOU61_26380 [Bradyrhizobium sp. NP1]